MRLTKSKLKIQLSKLKEFEDPKLDLEQYPTPGDIAADILWNAHMLKDIEDRTIIDAGCGTGRFGIGALLLGAKFVYFIDIDIEALNILKQNLGQFSYSNYRIINRDFTKTRKTGLEQIDTIIQNPPFGTKQEHADRLFLLKAFRLAPVIYSLHKTASGRFIEAIIRDNDYERTHYWEYSFDLKQTQKFHKRKIHRIDVGCWRLRKT